MPASDSRPRGRYFRRGEGLERRLPADIADHAQALADEPPVPVGGEEILVECAPAPRDRPRRASTWPRLSGRSSTARQPNPSATRPREGRHIRRDVERRGAEQDLDVRQRRRRARFDEGHDAARQIGRPAGAEEIALARVAQRCGRAEFFRRTAPAPGGDSSTPTEMWSCKFLPTPAAALHRDAVRRARRDRRCPTASEAAAN